MVSNFSPEFLSKYEDWRKSRFEALISKRICDSGWYQALSNDHIWHNWFLDGIVESDTIVSRSTLAHIYDNVKAKPSGTTPSIGSAKRGPLVLHRARNAHIRFKQQIDFFCPLQLRGQRPTRQSRSDSGLSSPPSTAQMPRSPVRPLRSDREVASPRSG